MWLWLVDSLLAESMMGGLVEERMGASLLKTVTTRQGGIYSNKEMKRSEASHLQGSKDVAGVDVTANTAPQALEMRMKGETGVRTSREKAPERVDRYQDEKSMEY